MATVVIGADLSLDVVVGKHRVVESDTALVRVAFAFVLVVVDAVDVDDALVVASVAVGCVNLN